MRKLTAAIVILAVATVITVAVAQQTKRTETGTVTAELIEYDFANNDLTATGNVSVNIEGRHVAKLRSPMLSVDMNDKMNRILKLVAGGPVNFDVLTAPDVNGLRRKIVASCSSRATYDAGSEMVTMSGNAEADVSTLPEGNMEAAHFTGESITVNLRTSMLSVKQAEISVTTEVTVDEGE